jgi:lantibiotic modifying enzyme
MSFDPSDPLSVALGIARHLADQAVWWGDRCTWLGTTQDAEDDSDQVEFTYGTVGADLYGGVAGIALFLAECARHEPGLGTTAIGALQQGIVLARAMPPDQRWGFQSGTIGVAWALARAGRLLDRDDLRGAAGELLSGLGSVPAGLPVDYLGGAAGCLVPLLAMARDLGQPALRDRALELGESIVARADRRADPWVWPVAVGAIEAARPLTGLSHGAAGIGVSLLELGHATGRSDLVEAGRQAFRYENQWFRAEAGNWPDFRDADGDDAGCCIAWCHGAPGIALTRLRAVVLGYPEYRGDLDAALATTVGMLADQDEWIEGDCSLCHGRAGLGEVLRAAKRFEPEVRAAAVAAAARFGEAWTDWPCGVRRGGNPSLMLGLAGIGYWYLGLADARLPGVLLPEAG